MGAIIAAIIGGLAAIATTGMSNKAIEDAQNEAKGLAMLKRRDEMAINATNERLAEKRIKLGEKELAFVKGREKFARAERAEERGFARRQTHRAEMFNMVNQNDSMRKDLVNIWGRRAA